MYLIFDTETTGLPKKWNAPLTDSDNWPRCVQLSWQIHDQEGALTLSRDYLIKPDGFKIPYDSEKIHGISTELATQEGESINNVLSYFQDDLTKVDYIIGHNVKFDRNILGAEFIRNDKNDPFPELKIIDTCTEETANVCQIKGGPRGRFKLPTLTELYFFLFNDKFKEAHNATADVEATARVFFELIRRKLIKPIAFDDQNLQTDQIIKIKNTISLYGIKHKNLRLESQKLKSPSTDNRLPVLNQLDLLKDYLYVHLHNHTQFSVLQSTTRISQLVDAAVKHNMPAVAITDHANLMGAFHFINYTERRNKDLDENEKIKPIIGCEFFVCQDHKDKSHRDDGYQIVFLAKNKRGYYNLAKMSSLGHTDGFYYVPRIDKKIIENYKDDLIVLSGNTYGEIPSKILKIGEDQAEKALEWWVNTFKNDFYIELMRHGEEQENIANEVLLNFSKKYKIKTIATNNTYYVNQEEANAHDILLCLKDGEKQSTPIGKGRGFRYGLNNKEYYFKTSNEMKTLFSDLPEAIINIKELVEKIDRYTLSNEIQLPRFEIPNKFIVSDSEDSKLGENNYLRHLTIEGAKKRYKKLNNETKERIDFELKVIANTGYPGYFLIVQDFISSAKKMGVSVGPGRGSAAGSVVAYCLGITNIDPIKYDLLFERFLNPDRISMPDIDIDFDDEGRSKVIDYVIQKYGAKQVAQIITYGTMAAKSSIRDTARVLDLPLADADRVAKLIPNIKLSQIFSLTDKELSDNFRTDEIAKINEIKKISNENSLTGETINQAKVLEGSLRNVGTHACGVIITPDDITQFVPISTAKDSDLYVTQFDNSVVESAGLLKMDFLGLKTLSLIKDTVNLVKKRYNKDLNPDNFPLDDIKTYELFQRGETVGIFQYESLGMQKYLKDLKPNVFADLIAMNALYRPGPLEYIPTFVKRKNGQESISYDLPEMKLYLKETYGITVYQEQVMQLSQVLSNFSKGQADILRKAMGKKDFSLLQKLKPQFINGGKSNGHDVETLEKIWKDWEAFAAYAFNKSHSTCYALIGFQTAYLKTHYPEEYMAAVLSNNMNDIKQVSFFMEECRRMGLIVLGPCVNESDFKFTVNEKKQIRFGMGAIKGVGQGAVETIIENRRESNYMSIFDLTQKIDLRLANKKALENLALAGGLDSLGESHRAQFFNPDGDGIIFLEKAIRRGGKYQDSLNSSQINLFEEDKNVLSDQIKIPECEEWRNLEKLKKEKEVVGIYLSGHPLDDFAREMKLFSPNSLKLLSDLEAIVNKELSFCGIVSSVEHRVSRAGKGWAIFQLEDFKDVFEFKIFGEEYLKFRHFIVTDQFIRLKIKIQQGWINRESGRLSEPRIKFNNFESLHDVIKNNSKKLQIQLDLNTLDENRVLEISEIINKFKGEKSITIQVYHIKEKINLSLLSRKYKIDVSKELLNKLDSVDLPYLIN
ncbi:MAG: DNA polymerase III subunit alpha [Flavobacteriaceae bacterium TMED200]|nr:DNA polymerase III subunit alpha [Flavobacteriaceae bacterium]OUW66498.1 MAG: DNA polymerase III subunit alpha [Flavobacteriaceae bacterium TMED200]